MIDLTSKKRILIIGICGSGKSTLARLMAEKTGLPLIHLDQHFWKPGWVPSEQKFGMKRLRSLQSENVG